MCCKAVIALVLGLAGVAAAQERGGFAGERMVTVTAGIGNAMGWFGAQGERYFLDERISIFAGVGYTPRLDRGEPDGPTFAPDFARSPPAPSTGCSWRPRRPSSSPPARAPSAAAGTTVQGFSSATSWCRGAASR